MGTPIFQLGLIADCQHGDKPARNGRTYRESLDRLALAVQHLNKLDDLHAVLHLGDVIDGQDTLHASLADLVRAVYFLLFVQLFEKYGTLIERNAALIEKVSPCRPTSWHAWGNCGHGCTRGCCM
eukprot:SAG31_NODE_1968_length_6780_cov_1.940129_2_plen_125_part_00